MTTKTIPAPEEVVSTGLLPDTKPPAFSRVSEPVRRPLTFAVVCGIFATICMIVQMGALAWIVDDFVIKDHSIQREYYLAAVILGTSILRFAFQWGADTFGDLAAVKAVASLRKEVLEHIFKTGPLGLIDHTSGQIGSALINGIDALGPFVARYIPRMAAMVITPIIILGVVFHLDTLSFIVLVITGPLIPVFMALVGYAAQSILDKQWAELLRLSGSFLDFLRGMTTLRLFGRAENSARQIDLYTDLHRKETLRAMRVAFLTSAVLEFFSSLSIAMVAVLFGARLLDGKISFFTAFFVLLLAPEYFLPLRVFSASYHARQNAVSAFTPLQKLLSTPPFHEVAQEQGTYIPSGSSGANNSPLQKLTFEHVNLGYSKNHSVLKDINLSFSRDGLNVVRGPSGAGKSTLYRSILGMLPLQEGHIWGVSKDGAAIARNDIKFGWVPQKPYFLSGSVRDNLKLVNKTATDQELTEALKKANAYDFVAQLPEGLNFVLSEGGSPLSGGQVRRLAVARALLSKPELLLLDEPTADLDAAGAELITEAIQKLSSECLTIAISHRSELMKYASHVYELHNGALKEISLKGAIKS